MATATILPMFPDSLVLTGTDQRLRRDRITAGAHRVWHVLPRYGTANHDRWTLEASPVPAENNPAAAYEDGQYASLADAYAARDAAELLDTGAHDED